MARNTFGQGKGEGKLEMIGDPRYGLSRNMTQL